MTPTLENITEIAAWRAPRHGLDPQAVIERAMYYANRNHHPAPTAPAAVEWAMQDLDTADRDYVDEVLLQQRTQEPDT